MLKQASILAKLSGDLNPLSSGPKKCLIVLVFCDRRGNPSLSASCPTETKDPTK